MGPRTGKCLKHVCYSHVKEHCTAIQSRIFTEYLMTGEHAHRTVLV